MAAATIVNIGGRGINANIVKWAITDADSTGDSIHFPEGEEVSIQITGTFGVGGTIILEGSNSGIVFSQLRNPQGTLISMSAAAIQQVQEHARYYRVRRTAGVGVAVTAAMLIKKLRF